MPAGQNGKEWQFYLVASDKTNSRNYRVWCRATLEYHGSSIIDTDEAYQVKQVLTSEEEAELVTMSMIITKSHIFILS